MTKSLVKWKGYSDDFNSWVDNKEIENISEYKMISIENGILPNKPLSNFELEDAAKSLKIPSFRGVFFH